MPLSVGELGQIVWAETSALGPGRADGSGDVNAVRRLVAQLAASLSGAGFNRRQPLPALTDPQYGETSGAIKGIAEAVKDAAAPQPRLIFWDAGRASSKLNVATDPPPPEPWKVLKSVVVELGNGQKLPAGFKSHGTPPTDYFWSLFWTIPADFPTGSVGYKVVATMNDGSTVTWEPFIRPTTQLMVVAGEPNMKK